MRDRRILVAATIGNRTPHHPMDTAQATATLAPERINTNPNPNSPDPMSDATDVDVNHRNPHEPSPDAEGAGAPATRVFEVDNELTYELTQPTNFLFQIHALHGMDQEVLAESLQLTPRVASHVYADPNLNNRFLRLQAPAGQFRLHYKATVQVGRRSFDTTLTETPIEELPDSIMHNLMSTRYCESDLLGRAAFKLFGQLPPGYARVAAITQWIHDNIDYQPGTSDATTTARDVFWRRAGVCRDFAHLGVTFCRALNIPARLVVGYAKFDSPPPDFHAVFEAYLGGQWVLFDPTQMSPLEDLVRIAVGRDAKDVAFSTIFGPARMLSMSPKVEPAA
jgi:transglutaminase-like putative cysteine protease